MTSHCTLPTSFRGFSLDTASYLLNLVPSKSVPKTPAELWNGRKPSMRYFHIWGCLAHVLKGKPENLEPKDELYLFVGYLRGTKGGLFYNPEDKNVFVSQNATFLEKDYVNNHMSKSIVVLEEMLDARAESSP